MRPHSRVRSGFAVACCSPCWRGSAWCWPRWCSRSTSSSPTASTATQTASCGPGASAEVSSLHVTDGRIVLAEAPDAGNPDAQMWVFQGGRALERPRPSPNDQAAAALAARAPATADVAVTDTRLYALPVAQAGRRVGAVVAGYLARSLPADAANRADRLADLRARRAGGGRAIGPVADRPGAATRREHDPTGRRLERARPRPPLRARACRETNSRSSRAPSTGCSSGSRRACATNSAYRPRSRTSCARRSRASSPRRSTRSVTATRPTSPQRRSSTSSTAPGSSAARSTL